MAGCLFRLISLQSAASPRQRIAAGVRLAAQGAVLLLTFSRSGWLGFAGGALFVSRQSDRRTRTVVLAGAACVLLAAALVRTHGALGTPANDRSAAGRTVIWSHAIHEIAANPFAARGFAAFGTTQFVQRGLQQGRWMSSTAKNTLLDLYLNLGPLGFVAFLVFAAGHFPACRESRDGSHQEKERPIRFSSDALLVSFCIAGVFDTLVLGEFVDTASTALLLTLFGLVSRMRLSGDDTASGLSFGRTARADRQSVNPGSAE